MNLRLVLLMIMLVPVKVFAWGTADFKQELLSPMTTDARYLIYGGTALTLTLMAFEDKLDLVHDQVVTDQSLGSWSEVGDIGGQLVPNALYMFYQWIYGRNDRAQGMFKATAYSSGVTTILKYTIRQPRPNDSSTKNSFPSGHTTTAFAFAGYVAAEHGYFYGIPAGLFAGFVGFSRMNDNKHRIHDIVAGATIGAAYGWGIQALGMKPKNEESLVVVPVFERDFYGVALQKRF